MPTTNYLNPASFAPSIGWQPQGAEAGWIHAGRQQDYEELMKNQFLLQSMATQNAGIDLYKNLQDVPMEDLKRSNTMDELMAKKPFIPELARTGAQKDIAANTFSSDITHGPEARTAGIRGFVDQISKSDFEKVNRETQLSLNIMERMQAMGPQGAAWAQQEIDRLNKLGYNLDANLANPEVVKAMYPRFVELNAEFQRRMKETSYKEGEHNKRNAEDNRTRLAVANAQIAAAEKRAAASGNKPPRTIEQLAVQQVQEARDTLSEFGPDSKEYKEAVANLDPMLDFIYNKTQSKIDDKELESLAGLKMTPEKRAEWRENKVEEFKRKYRGPGVGSPTPKPGGQPAATSGGRWEKMPNGGERWVP